MEVYGEKPKKFTKDWWSYIWYYYKWHIMATAFAIFVVISTLRECATRTEYDLQVDILTEQALVLTQEDNLRNMAEGIVLDATGNEKNEVCIMPIYINQNDVQTVQAGYARLAVEIASPNAYVFIMSEQFKQAFLENGILESTKVWLGDAAEDEYLISLKGNEKLKELGIDSDSQELYIGVVKLFEDRQQDEVERARYENGVRLARYLIGLE